MSLTSLPPELLMRVLEFVSPAYFREDVRRLAISKIWFKCARDVLFMDLELSQRSLRRLLSSSGAEASLLLVKVNLRLLSLKLKGFEDWEATPDTLSRDVSSWDSHDGRAVLAHWTRQLDHDLNQLATVVKDARNLRVIHIQAASEHHPMLPNLPRRDYLHLATVRALILVKNLTVLDLDTCGTSLVSPVGHGDFHLCESIGSLLATLRSLRIRLRSICADVLKPQENATLSLSKVVLNLSLSDNESPSITSMTHSMPCHATAESFLQLKTVIEQQAQDLASRMACPRLFRILSHSLPQFELQSLDVLSGRHMILADDSAWEDDGIELSEPGSDASSEISSLTSDE